VAAIASEFHALSSVRVAAALDQALDDQGRSLDVFLQVNSSGEPQKFGLPPDEVEAFAIALKAFTTLRVRGLMTLAVLSDDEREIRSCFERMRDLQRRLQSRGDCAGTYDELSMGMSGDLELAIEYGATTVRVGQAIFGPRSSPDTEWVQT
jgi:pyridoxal phosphate enzyme (YggS family)